MTEVDAWTLLNEFNNSGMNGMALYMTVTSGYLIIAYLVGKNLTTYQVALISIMFVIFALLFTYGVLGFFDRASYFATQINQYTDSTFRQRRGLAILVGAVNIIGVLACLIFMWQVRNAETE